MFCCKFDASLAYGRAPDKKNKAMHGPNIWVYAGVRIFMDKYLTVPCEEKVIRDLHSGDYVYLSLIHI